MHEEKPDISYFVHELDMLFAFFPELSILKKDWENTRVHLYEAMETVSGPFDRLRNLGDAMEHLFNLWITVENIGRAKSLTFSSIREDTPQKHRTMMLMLSGVILMLNGTYLALRQSCLEILTDILENGSA